MWSPHPTTVWCASCRFAPARWLPKARCWWSWKRRSVESTAAQSFGTNPAPPSSYLHLKHDRERIFTMAEHRQAEHERVGSIAGLGAGVIAGAQLGTVLIPIPIIGTFTGALVGGVFGSEIGRNVGAALLDGVSAFTDSLSGRDDDSDGGTPPPGQGAF